MHQSVNTDAMLQQMAMSWLNLLLLEKVRTFDVGLPQMTFRIDNSF
jgi:hypothetical protein